MSVHILHIRIRSMYERYVVVVHIRYIFFICIQLYAYVTHFSSSVVRLRTTIRICNM